MLDNYREYYHWLMDEEGLSKSYAKLQVAQRMLDDAQADQFEQFQLAIKELGEW